jgi:alkylated DNA nucleotide flippase Atl1
MKGIEMTFSAEFITKERHNDENTDWFRVTDDEGEAVEYGVRATCTVRSAELLDADGVRICYLIDGWVDHDRASISHQDNDIARAIRSATKT